MESGWYAQPLRLQACGFFFFYSFSFNLSTMTKFYFLSVFLFAGILNASSQATFSAITINKKVQPGLELQLPNNTDVAEGTILQKLKETGYSPESKGSLFWKKNKQDGFYVFNGITLPELNNQKVDLYFKVEPKSKTQKEQSTIYMLVSKGYDNYVSPELDTAAFGAATAFLNGFVTGTASYSLNLDIEEQEKVVQSAEKKLVDLQDDDKAILKKIEGLQADLRNKKDGQLMQEKEIANQKLKLEALKAKVAKQ